AGGLGPRRGRAAVDARGEARGRRELRAGRHRLADAERAGPLAGAPRVRGRRRALLRRRAVRRLGRTHRPTARRPRDADGLDRDARRAVPGGDGGLPGPRAGDDDRRRARAQPVSRRAPRRTLVTPRYEAPRGTHDVLDADWPHWSRIVREAERLAAL